MIQRYERPRYGLARGRLRWLLRQSRNGLVYLVWIAVLAVTVHMFLTDPQLYTGARLRGVVESDAVNISPVETARIRTIHAVEGARVKAGDLLVEMDTALIDHGVTADLVDAIRIETAFGDTHQDVLQAVSQQLDTLASFENEMALCRQEWDREAAELEALRAEQRRRDQLRTEGLVDELVRTELLPAQANLEKAVAAYPQRMAMLERQFKNAGTYYTNVMSWLGAAEGEPISEAIQRRLKEKEIYQQLKTAESQAHELRQAYFLRAPQDGIVSHIAFRAGDVVVAGFPILRVAKESPDRVVAYLDETQTDLLPPGSRVMVHSALRRPARQGDAEVEKTGHEIQVSAYVTAPTGRQVPLRGRRVNLRLAAGHELIGGETVHLIPRDRVDWLQRVKLLFVSKP